MRKNGAGQSLVEFALILPLMVLVIAGLFDLGRAFYASITITNAAREGARYGTLHPDDITGMEDAAVRETINSGILINTGNIGVTCPDDNNDSKCDRSGAVKVTVTYLYDDMILGFFFPSGITLERFVEMQVP